MWQLFPKDNLTPFQSVFTLLLIQTRITQITRCLELNFSSGLIKIYPDNSNSCSRTPANPLGSISSSSRVNGKNTKTNKQLDHLKWNEYTTVIYKLIARRYHAGSAE